MFLHRASNAILMQILQEIGTSNMLQQTLVPPSLGVDGQYLLFLWGCTTYFTQTKMTNVTFIERSSQLSPPGQPYMGVEYL